MMAQRQDDTHYTFDQHHQLYRASRVNPATLQWEFVQWMPRGFQPPQQPATFQPATPQQPKRRDSLQLSSPASGHSASPSGATSSPRVYSFESTRQPYNAIPFRSNPTSSAVQGRPVSGHGNTQNPRFFPRGEGDYVVGQYNAQLGSNPNNLHYEEVNPSYYVRSKDFFKEGKVFAVILSEPAGSTTAVPTSYNSSSSISEVRYRGNLVHTQTRRFVVVRAKREFCFACPIFTYSNRATLKGGVRPEEHGIAYSDGGEPRLLPGEVGIRKPSVGVVMAAGESSLHIASRIYYGIHHPIQYNVKVKDIGQVLQHHVVDLIGNWMAEGNGDTKQSADVTASADDPEVLPPVLEEPNEEGEQSRKMSKKAGKARASKHAPPDPPRSPTGHKDPHLYDPEGNVYGYDSDHNPHMYHPQYNPYGYHPKNNKHGYHPASNPYSYHPDHNPHGHHPQDAPYCYHPTYCPHGYHTHQNPRGYHPYTAPYNYHPKANPHGYHEELNSSGFHPEHDQYRYHPHYNPHGYHVEHNRFGHHQTINQYAYHERYNPTGYHPKLNKSAYHPKRNPKGIYQAPPVAQDPGSATQVTSVAETQSNAGAAEGGFYHGGSSAQGQSHTYGSNAYGEYRGHVVEEESEEEDSEEEVEDDDENAQQTYPEGN